MALVLGLMHAPLMAQSPSAGALGVCNVSPLAGYVQPKIADDEDDDTVYLSANYGDNTELFSNVKGDVTAFYGNRRVDGDSFTLDRKQNILSGKNQRIRYSSDSEVMESGSFTSYLTEKHYEATDVTYYLHNQEAQGTAKYGINRQNERTSDFEEATYSTCPVDSEVWRLSAEELHLDEVSGRGIARKAKLSLFGMPVFYAPYFSFPIDDRRQTGFLFPIISMDKKGGVSVRAPFYWNIAPNFDMTLTPGFYTRRGAVLGAEARYLNKWQRSELRLEFLPNDRVFKRDETGRINGALLAGESHEKRRDAQRWSVYFQQSMHLAPKLRGQILFQQVSDTQYVEDMHDAIGLLSKTNLERVAELTYSETNWQTSLRFQHFQILDREVIPNNPYARMPQLLLSGHWENGKGLIYGISAEAVNFDTRISTDKTRPKSAIRFDIMPYVGYRFENSWGFFEPRLGYRYTHYDLKYQYSDNSNINKIIRGKPTTLDRGLPIFNIDTGIVLERNTSFTKIFGGGDFIQTLEPRLFYLYVPYRNQSDIPLFDTGTITPSFSNLFSTNQFTGTDRQSNANQITMALTTRFINEETGIEHLRLSAGQIYYIDSPRITTGKDIPTRDECYKMYSNNQSVDKLCKQNRSSEWFIENNILLARDITSRVTWQWSPDIKKTTRLAFDLRYQPSPRKVINIGQRYSRSGYNNDNITHQLDLTSFWEFNNNWAIVGQYNYSLDKHRLNDSYIGFEYSDCCVATRVAARYYRNNIDDDEKKWKVYLQFELKGLGNFGQDTNTMWSESIPGYQSKYLTRNRGF